MYRYHRAVSTCTLNRLLVTCKNHDVICCSSAAGQLKSRDWTPLHPDYDFLRLMDEEEEKRQKRLRSPHGHHLHGARRAAAILNYKFCVYLVILFVCGLRYFDRSIVDILQYRMETYRRLLVYYVYA